MRASFAVLLLVVPAALAGCVGSEDALEPGADDLRVRATPEVTATTGAVEGVITDDAVRPVPGATVSLLEIELSATTRNDGSYAMSEVRPGSYTLVVRATGFVPAAVQVLVRATEIAAVDLVLIHVVSDLPYVQTLELAGFMACGAAGGYNLSMLPPPPAPLPDPRQGGLAWTMCEDVDYALGNTTQDETFWLWEMDPPLHTIVYEIAWDARGNQLAEEMWSRVNAADWARELSPGPYTVIDVFGTSPLLARVDRQALEAIQANFTELCEAGDDAYCGHSFFDEGWKLAAAVLPFWRCLNEEASACAAVEQDFALYVTGFYNAPAPEAWSIVKAGEA